MKFKKCAKTILHICIILSSFIGILLQCGLGSSSFSFRTFRMFTTLSNLAVLIYFLFDLFIPRNNLMRKMKFTITLCIMLTGLVAAILLRGMFDSMTYMQRIGIFLLHDVTPICTVLDYFVFDEKGYTTKDMPLIAADFPLLYVTYIFITASSYTGSDKYPYPFININQIGLPMVCINIILLAIIFIGVGYLIIFMDHKMKEGKKYE